MSFKENLLKKIQIDKLVNHIISTIGPIDSNKKVDKQAMRSLVELGPYEMRKERDLELYIKQNGPEKKQILVLDNDLSIYHTDIEDVALRKSPTVKEMISIRNVIKILNDSKVVKSKKEESVRTIQKECIQQLDLNYTDSDIEQIKNDGKSALDLDDKDGVVEALELFAELLNLVPPPKKVFRLDNFIMFGKIHENNKGEIFFGPIILYSLIRNELKLIDKEIGSYDKAGIEMLNEIANGSETASKENLEVFEYLKTAVLQNKDITQESSTMIFDD
jgi:t-SNARE complex subunit (syntaxin)